ncbi:MAG TPA: ABC transporter substrate-binding protein [Planctomycetota bacterium]|jgi:peptide/nickel transport system substrate-binding protein|nr:ABC transporter substrate-binding protein [Planctomycetota bacterium]
MSRISRCVLLLAVLGSCRDGAADPSVLIWARSADSSTLDPAEIEWGEDAKVIQSLYDTLVTYRGDTVELEPKLAERWMVSPDGKTLTFDLRRGIVFHDGTPLDAAAVVFTFERFLKPDHPYRPKNPCPYGSNFSDIQSVVAESPHRVVFTLKRPNVVMLYNLTLFAAHIVSPSAVKSHGAQFPVHPVGSGPYRLARWDRDVRIVLDRNDAYWGPRPAIPRVIVVPVKSPQTAIEKLKAGEVQVVDHPTLADAKTLEEDPRTKIDTESSLTVSYLGFNLQRPPYSDPNFRRAVSLALDRRTLNELAYHGLAEPAANLVPPALWKNACPTPPYEFDLEKARQALAKVKLGSKEVELIHMTFSRPYVPEPLRVAEFVKDQLRKIGLDVKLTGYDKAAYDQKYRDPNHPMYLLGWIADIPDPDNFYYPLLHGDSKNDMNASFFDDPEFNDAVTQAQVESDSARRAALWTKAYGRYRDVLPTIPLVHVKQIIGLSRRVHYNMHPIEVRFYAASWSK